MRIRKFKVTFGIPLHTRKMQEAPGVAQVFNALLEVEEKGGARRIKLLWWSIC
jgi:hypothetical protein